MVVLAYKLAFMGFFMCYKVAFLLIFNFDVKSYFSN